MDALSHYRLGQDLAAKADQLLERYDRNETGRVALEEACVFAYAAQVHATLALAGVTALAGDLPDIDYERWRYTVAVTAPIPPETDDEDND